MSRERPADSAAPAAAGAASSVGAYYPWLDALRGVSWILVMIGHTTPHGYLARMGVGIFFAISGWLITKIILGQFERRWSLTAFYTRRAIRIIPLYWVLIAVAMLSSLVLPTWKAHFEWLPPDVPEHALWKYLLTFATEYWRGGGGGFLVGHCWSLGVEERFYVFWPLLLALWPRIAGARQLLIVALIAFWSLALRPLSTEDVTIALWAMPFPLLFGCALAIFSPFRPGRASRLVTFPAAAVVLWLYVKYAVHMEPRFGPTVCTFSLTAGVLAMALAACAVATSGEPRNGLIRLLQGAGKISYAAYLFHPICALVGVKVARAAGFVWIGPVVGVAMIAPLAFAIHRFIETPVLDTRTRVERSLPWRVALATLQVTPILVGLVLLFPWRGLLGVVEQHPYAVPMACVVGLAATVVAAYWVAARWRPELVERVRQLQDATLGAVRRHRGPEDVLARWRRGTAALAAAMDRLNELPDLPRWLRRCAIVVDLVIYVAAASLVFVAATGGGSTNIGPIPLGLRHPDRPLTILVVALLLRKVVFGTFSDAALWRRVSSPLAAVTGRGPSREAEPQ